MPEIPEIASRAAEMNLALPGQQIRNIEILQPKCLNLSAEEFCTALTGAVINEVTCHGKWIKVKTSLGWLLLNLGMGGELLLLTRTRLPQKYRLVFDFQDETCLVVNFWWFGYAFYAQHDQLDSIKMIAKLGPNVLDMDEDEFSRLLQAQRRKQRVKSFLLDQSNIAGIGNAYIHDILFLAGLHPLALLADLDDNAVVRLYNAIQSSLRASLSKGGAFYETNLFGEKGGFSMDDILIAYKAGQPCPRCGTAIEKIQTGSTSSFICPACQPLQEN